MHPFTTSEMLACLANLLPELTLGVTALAAIVFDWFLKPADSRRIGFVAVFGAIAALIAGLWSMTLPGAPSLYFRGMLAQDELSLTFRLLFIAAAIVAFVFTLRSKTMSGLRLGEFYSSVLVATMGMCLLTAAADWIMFFIALETVSLPSYVLAGYLRRQRPSVEASLKYVLYGSAAGGVMLFGVSFLYGLSGTTAMAESFAAASEANAQVYAVALVLVLAGLLFKIAAVPFQFWCPDVYEGAPTPVTAWLSVASKAAGFAAVLRVFSPLFDAAPDSGAQHVAAAAQLPWLFWALSAVTMTYGNLAAIKQNNLKRLLAYSSIAHAGYLLMALTVIGVPGAMTGAGNAVSVLLFYLLIYFVMNFGAFYCVQLMENRTGRADIAAFRGVLTLDSPSSVSVELVVAMVLCLMSLTGLPILAGFIAKFKLFGVLIQQGSAMFVTLAVIGVINSVISLFYYFRIAKAMTLEKPERDIVGHYRLALFDRAALWAVSAALLWFFFSWDGLQALADASTMFVARF